MDNMNPKVAIVVLNYKGAPDTVACLASIKAMDYPNTRPIVVENASGDDSFAVIRMAHRDVEVIKAPTNLGFSGGNNLGIREALSDPEVQWIWLLNNDTTVPPETLTHMMAFAEAHPHAIVGPVVRYPDGQFQRVGNRIHPPLAKLSDYPEATLESAMSVESLTGASMLIPREVFETIGLWDDTFFLYFEDNDFCLRAKQAGFDNLICTDATVYHKEGASTGSNPPLVTYYYQRNRLKLAQKHFASKDCMVLWAYTLYRLFHSWLKTLRRPGELTRQNHRAFWFAVKDFFRGVSGPCPHAL